MRSARYNHRVWPTLRFAPPFPYNLILAAMFFGAWCVYMWHFNRKR
jgi:hypothetical protein